MRRLIVLALALVVTLAGARLLAGEQSPEQLLREADAYFARKTFRKALESYEKLLEAEPDYPTRAHAEIRVARCQIGLRQHRQAVEGLRKTVPTLEEGSLERAEAAHLLGATLGGRWGGSKEVVERLDEAIAVYEKQGRREERVRALFDLARALCYSWDYSIDYDEWQEKYDDPDPGKGALSWRDYQRREQVREDEERFARVVGTYEKIIAIDGGKGHDSALALYRLGCFHVNVLARAFRTGADYYDGLAPEEMAEKQEQALARYMRQIDLGLAAWRKLIATMPLDGLADDAQYLVARTMHMRKNDLVAAVKEYGTLLGAYPTTSWADTARGAVQSIQQEEIRLDVRRPFRPGEKVEIGLTARNVKRIEFTAWRVDMAAELKGDYKFHDLSTIDVSGLTPHAEWEVETGVADDYRGVRMAVELPFSTAGAFLVHADGDRRHARTLVVISNLGLAMKTSSDTALLFATDATTGEPRPGVRFQVKAMWRVNRIDHAARFEAVADEEGIAEIDLTGLPTHSMNVYVAGTKGDDVALSRNYRRRPGREAAYRVYTFTDRPVYRPNQTVHLKLVVRRVSGGAYRVAANQAVKVEVSDSRGQKILDETLLTNERGSLSADLTLGEEPPLGMYNVRTLIGGRQYNSHRWTGTRFRVEEYKKPEFEVTIDAGKARIEPGTKVTAEVSAQYYFGAPVANAEITWTVHRQPYRHWMPVKRRYPWYYEDIYPRPRHRWGRELVIEGKGLTDADGGFSIECDAKRYEDELDSRYFLQALVTDESRREIAGAAEIKATRQPFFTRAEARRGLFQPGDAVEVSLKAEDANRKPVKTEGKLVLAKRVDREKEEDGEKVWVTEWKEVGSVPASTREDGEGTASVVADEEGQFRLSYVAGPADAPIVSHAHVWVVTTEFRGAQYRFANVEVLTDRDTYAVGDEIEVLVNSHVKDAWILLSVEAGHEILTRKVVKAQGKSHVEKLRVTDGWTPNVFVKALTIRDSRVWMDRRQVIVPPVSKFLDVKIEPAKDGTYLPREEAAFTVTATNANGEPADTELSVGFVDKSIFYIQSDLTPDIRKFFYGTKRGDSVRLSSSFDFRHRGQGKLKPGESNPRYRSQGRPDFMNPYRYNFNGLRAEIRELWAEGAREVARKQQAQGGAHGRFGGRGGSRGDERLRRSRDGGPPATGAPGRPSAKGGALGEMAMPEEAEADAENMDWGEGGAGGGEETPAARKFFPDTAFWNAHVETGKDGKAEIRFAFPDSLTTWVATARGVTGGTAVGAATEEFVTTKNVIMRLQAPRFFRERDELVVSGIVHNYFDHAVDVKILVEVEGGTLEMLDRGELSRPEQTVRIKAGEDQRIDWWYRVLRPGRAKIRADARSARESDAVEMTFPVLEHGVEKFTALAGTMVGTGGRPAPDGAAEMTFHVPEDRHEDVSELVVTVNPSLASTLLETLPYLADYPHGCVEQTLSRFVPTAVVKKTLLDLGFTLADLGVDPAREVPEGYWGRKETQKLKVLRDEDLARAVARGVQRLADFQNSDGSWGWFKGSRADLRMTAYVVRGLALGRAAGAEIDAQMILRGGRFLVSQMKHTDPAEREEKGMAMRPDLLVAVASALLDAAETRQVSMSPETQALVGRIVGWLYDNREDLGATSRARLALALHRLDRTEQARVVCENLTDHATMDAETGTCRFGRVSGYYRWSDDAVEATSEALRAYLAVEPESELIPQMVLWIVRNRRGAHWKSTKDTAHATFALCEYLKRSEELAPDYTVKVTIDDRVTKSIRVSKENVFTLDNAITLKGAALPAGKHVVRIEKTGKGNLYYQGSLTVFTREEGVKAAGNEIAIERKVYRIHDRTREVEREFRVRGKKVKRTVTESYEEREPLPAGAVLSVGDEIEVELMLEAKNDYRYLVFEDMKGAGFEPVERKSGHAYSGILTFRELRDERAVFFVSMMRQGTHKLSYRLRAEIPGDFHVMPARGHAMYLPDVRAISDELRLSITEPGVR